MWNKEYIHVVENNVRDITMTDVLTSPILGFDVESTSLNPRIGTLLTVQLATRNNTYVYDARNLDLTPLFEKLKDYTGVVVVQNGSFDIKWVYHNYGFWWTSPKYFDTFHAQRLKNIGIARSYEEKFMGLDKLAAGYLQYELNKEIRDSFAYVGNDELTEQQIHYAAEDAAIMLPLYDAMLPKLKGRQSDFIIDLEMSLLPVTASMEYWGIPINGQLWEDIATEKEIERDANKDTFVELMSGYGWPEINPNSWQQLKKAFNEDVGIPIKDTTMDTFKDNRFKSPELIDPLIRYKQLKQPTTTFGKKWLRHVADDGRVYASFNQLGTDTGRYSSDSPNLQNIPVRDDPRYREAFIAREEHVIITADLAQIEYKIAGELSGEETIVSEYQKENPDFHQLTADQAGKFMGIDIPRDTGKTMNFALIYRAGPGRLIRVLGCDMTTAKKLHKAYWGGYPQLDRFMQQQGIKSRIRGYSETKLGRRRYFSSPVGAPKWMLNEVERQGGNMPIQGSAADILKVATLKMFPDFEHIGAKLIHQVHDEVVVDVKPELVEDAKYIINESMKYAGGLVLERTPIVTDFVVSDHWSK